MSNVTGETPPAATCSRLHYECPARHLCVSAELFQRPDTCACNRAFGFHGADCELTGPQTYIAFTCAAIVVLAGVAILIKALRVSQDVLWKYGKGSKWTRLTLLCAFQCICVTGKYATQVVQILRLGEENHVPIQVVSGICTYLSYVAFHFLLGTFPRAWIVLYGERMARYSADAPSEFRSIARIFGGMQFTTFCAGGAIVYIGLGRLVFVIVLLLASLLIVAYGVLGRQLTHLLSQSRYEQSRIMSENLGALVRAVLIILGVYSALSLVVAFVHYEEDRLVAMHYTLLATYSLFLVTALYITTFISRLLFQGTAVTNSSASALRAEVRVGQAGAAPAGPSDLQLFSSTVEFDSDIGAATDQYSRKAAVQGSAAAGEPGAPLAAVPRNEQGETKELLRLPSGEQWSSARPGQTCLVDLHTAADQLRDSDDRV